MQNTVMPARARSAKRFMIRASLAGSRLLVASSTIKRPGLERSSTARLPRLISPPDRMPAGVCRTCSSLTSLTTRSMAR